MAAVRRQYVAFVAIVIVALLHIMPCIIPVPFITPSSCTLPTLSYNLADVYSSGPPLPSKAFFITLPATEAKNVTKYAIDEIERVSTTAGINMTDMEKIYGLYDGRYGDVKQIGLSLAHLDIWTKIVERNLTGAWIFEDDVLFHDDFDSLFPEYWRHVPTDYEVVWIGHHPLSMNPVACEEDTTRLFHNGWVFCTHAMVVSNAGATRLKRGMEGLLSMAKKANRTINGLEIKIDLYINYIGNSFLLPAERYKWVMFDSTRAHPAQFGGVQWCRYPDMNKVMSKYRDCCETCDVSEIRKEAKQAMPVSGTGLAYQHRCKKNPWALDRWRIKQN